MYRKYCPRHKNGHKKKHGRIKKKIAKPFVLFNCFVFFIN